MMRDYDQSLRPPKEFTDWANNVSSLPGIQLIGEHVTHFVINAAKYRGSMGLVQRQIRRSLCF